MARVGNVPVVSAYRGNIGQQMMGISERLEGISEDYERKQQQELAEAKKLYTQGLNYNLYEGINELRNDPNYSANPKGLSDAMDKVLEKTLSDVNDDEVKSAVMVDYQLKKGTYINHAQTEFNRIQREKARSSAFDTVYANIDSMGLSFANALSGNYTDDDIVNFQHSQAAIMENINAKNPDGTYVFTDKQRRKMQIDAKASYLKGFEAIYGQLDEQQQEDIARAINEDKMDLVEISNGEQKGSIKLKDVVGEASYNDMKDYLRKYQKKKADAFLKQQKEDAEIAAYEYTQNRTAENKEKALSQVEFMSKDWKNMIESIINKEETKEAESKYSNFTEALNGIREVMNTKYGDDTSRIKAQADVLSKIQNMTPSESDNPYAFADEQDIRTSQLIHAMTDEDMKKFTSSDLLPILNDSFGWQTKVTHNMGIWERLTSSSQLDERLRKFAYLNEDIETKDVRSADREYIRNMLNDYNKASLEIMINDNIPNEKKKELLIKNKKQIQRNVLEYMYPNIIGKNAGDKITVNGKVYTITGIDDTVTLGK